MPTNTSAGEFAPLPLTLKRSPTAARVAWCLVLAAATAGCAAPASSNACGPIPAVVVPGLVLVYPANGSTNVPRTVGQLVFQNGYTGESTIQLFVGTVASSPVGPLGPPPSPLPSPLPTAPPNSVNFYLAASVPTLAPSTTYSVTYDFTYQDSQPPCIKTGHAIAGTFTTQ
ncbi:MAG: hypothetical protein JOZ24_12290 [Candidatus Eremiobacteraeota bacterium]|nr:hypothetical protein [Candidatus Eremiobacteraeota bacterium]